MNQFIQFALQYPLFTALVIIISLIWAVMTWKDFNKPPHWKDTDWRKR